MTVIALIMIIGAAVYRLMPVEFHPYNMAPIGAMALMGGMYFGRRFALWVPLLVLGISDVILNARYGESLFYWGRLIDYGAFMLIGMMGIWAGQRRLPSKLGSVLATPFLFFLISNFGSWLTGLSLANQPYSKTVAGLIECYMAGLVFLRGTILGDYLFAGLFAVIALIALRHGAIREQALTPAGLEPTAAK